MRSYTSIFACYDADRADAQGVPGPFTLGILFLGRIRVILKLSGCICEIKLKFNASTSCGGFNLVDVTLKGRIVCSTPELRLKLRRYC